MAYFYYGIGELKPLIISGKYLIDERCSLGSGAYANVYKGINLLTCEEVAVKKLNFSSGDVSEIELRKKSFFNEKNIFETLNKSKNPFILKMYEAFDNDTNGYIILEFCNEKTLEDKIKDNGSLKTIEDQLFAIFQIILGRIELEKANIIHGDLNPTNIFMKNGLCKIADFGISLETSENFEVSHCTANYMAWEMVSNEDGVKLTYKVDIWSMGLIFHEILTREK